MNKTIATMCHARKDGRMKGKGFMAMMTEVGEIDTRVKLALDLHQVFINRMLEKIKQMSPT